MYSYLRAEGGWDDDAGEHVTMSRRRHFVQRGSRDDVSFPFLFRLGTACACIRMCEFAHVLAPASGNKKMSQCRPSRDGPGGWGVWAFRGWKDVCLETSEHQSSAEIRETILFTPCDSTAPHIYIHTYILLHTFVCTIPRRVNQKAKNRGQTGSLLLRSIARLEGHASNPAENYYYPLGDQVVVDSTRIVPSTSRCRRFVLVARRVHM